MAIFFFVVFIIYVFFMFSIAFGWAKLSDQKKSTENAAKFISVVIPFRNERDNLYRLLDSIGKQSYPQDYFEIIFVNDHSEDGSVKVLQDASKGNIQILELPAGFTGKKTALDFGIQKAKGGIIVTTDADCLFFENWLNKINECFSSETIKMVVGPVRIESTDSFFSRLQALEFTSLAAVTGAAISFKLPVMCNGANLAFLKSAYRQVNGYDGNIHIASGDDEFLMRKISSRWKNSVHYLFDQAAIVSTLPQPSLRAFIQQRLRWAGKWKYNSSFLSQAMAMTILIFHLFFLSSWVYAFAGSVSIKIILSLWLMKMFAETIVLFPVSNFLQQRWRWLPFFTLQLLYSPYVLFIGMMSQIKGFMWKGRQFNSQ